MGVRIELSIEQLERAEKLLYGIPNGVETAESGAFNRGLTAGKTEASKQIRQRYAIASGTVNKYQRVTLQRSSGGGDAAIVFSGPKIPLFKFKPSPASRTYVGEKIPVPIRGDGENGDAVWRMVFKNAKVRGMDAKASGFKSGKNWFIANFSSLHTGIFKRTGDSTAGNRAAIEEIWGFAVADMLDYEPAKEAVGKRIEEVVGQRLEHEIGRLLSRY